LNKNRGQENDNADRNISGQQDIEQCGWQRDQDHDEATDNPDGYYCIFVFGNGSHPCAHKVFAAVLEKFRSEFGS
jgi:hypothetical protein